MSPPRPSAGPRPPGGRGRLPWPAADGRPEICLSLTGRTLRENLGILDRSRPWCDSLELRVDFLQSPRVPSLRSFPARVGLPVILTVRRREDGGRFAGSERDRLALLRGLVSAGYRGVDLEADLQDEELERCIEAAGLAVIRSYHDCTGVPSDLAERVRRLPRRPGEVAKAAVMPRGSRDLLRLVQAGLELRGGPPARILLGLGGYGLPTRMLAARLGSTLTYCSAPSRETAPDLLDPHLDPRTLAELYRFRSITPSTPVYGVIGNPILHSRSPLIHNRGFAAAGFEGVYLPFQVDDLEAFFALADLLAVQGLSVTLPHKQGVIPFLAGREEAVAAVGACNTLVRRPQGWWGANTDVAGFLEPLQRRLPGGLPPGMGATVLGAGGAARAVVYALVGEGARVLILNRTPQRARRLAEEFGCRAGGLERADLSGHDELIVQTTSVGMKGAGGVGIAGVGRAGLSGVETGFRPADPLPGYRFSGREIVCDIIYTPPLTPFLRRAREAGCRIIPGMEMFLAQARAQFRLFTGREMPAAAEGGRPEDPA